MERKAGSPLRTTPLARAVEKGQSVSERLQTQAEGANSQTRTSAGAFSKTMERPNERRRLPPLNALRAFEAAELETEADLLFIGTVGEEGLGDLRGVKHLFGPKGPRIDAFIAVDGVQIGRQVDEGDRRLRLERGETGAPS